MADTNIDFVMGKGGVGRSTTSRLLAHHYAERGESTIIVECNGCADLPSLYGKQSQGYTPTHLTNLISTISVSPMAAIEDYVVQQLKLQKLYKLIFDNRLVAPLIEAAPGLHDAVQLGKIYDLQISGQWDHVVVDCPATGHGISLISAAKTMMTSVVVATLQSKSTGRRRGSRAWTRSVDHQKSCQPEKLTTLATMRPDFHNKVLEFDQPVATSHPYSASILTTTTLSNL